MLTERITCYEVGAVIAGIVSWAITSPLYTTIVDVSSKADDTEDHSERCRR